MATSRRSPSAALLKRGEIAAEHTRARDRSQSAVRETDMDPQDDAPEASGPRRSARIRATKSAPHPEEKDQLRPQQSHRQAPRPKSSTRSRPDATTVLDSEGDTTPAKPLAKKGKSTAPESRKSRQIPGSSKPKTVSKPQRKVTTKPNEQDPTSQDKLPRKGVEGGKAKRSGPAAGKSTRKTAKGKAKSVDPTPAPGSSSEPVPGEESDRRDRREFLDDHHALTREALGELEVRLAVANAARNKEPTYDSGTTYSDPREEFNYKYGCLPPLNEEASYIVAEIIRNPAFVYKMARNGPDSQKMFKKGLGQRNVATSPSTSVDPRSEEINSFSPTGSLQETTEQKQFCEHLWLQDKAKLGQSSNEAIFQRTLMVSLIARHVLIYEKKVNGEQLLDFSAEELWTCLPMPSQMLWKSDLGVEDKLLTQPKPDLAVCFRREAVIEDDLWRDLPDATKELACFENQSLGESRIFHFLVVEAKNGVTSIDDLKALYQCLNSASQALNNFYEFFQDAGPAHKQIFFDKVRFFSVVANTQGVLIRIHRAMEVPEDARRFALVIPNRPEYRLRFEYQEFARLTREDDKFTRAKVMEVFRKIFIYAVDELSVWISAAAKDLMEKLEKNDVAYQARRGDSFYRHGQPSPNTFKKTPRTSRVVDGKTSYFIERFLHANMDSTMQPIAEGSPNGQITPKANNPGQNSQLSTVLKKRNKDQVASEPTDSEESRVTGKRARKDRED